MHRVALHIASSPTPLIWLLYWPGLLIVFFIIPFLPQRKQTLSGKVALTIAQHTACYHTCFSIPNPAMPFKLLSGNVRPDPTHTLQLGSAVFLSTCRLLWHSTTGAEKSKHSYRSGPRACSTASRMALLFSIGQCVILTHAPHTLVLEQCWVLSGLHRLRCR